jgi:SAM-dependent methyltransferase
MRFSYVEIPVCIVCGAREQRKLGQRGNREYSGANPLETPHIHTCVVQCNNCGFIFCNPAIDGLEHLERDHYNDPESYGAYLGKNVYSPYRIGEALIKEFKAAGKLLDVGAGKGEFVSLSEKNGYEAKGIEPSQRFCQYAREKHGANVKQGYLGDEDSFKEELFDIITLFHVLEHVSYPQKLLGTVLDYLKEDGLIYIEVPNADSTLLKIADFLFRINGRRWSSRLSPLHPPFHSLGYSPKSLKYLLEHNGCDLVYFDTFPGDVRGYDIKGRSLGIFKQARNIVASIVNLFPNRELICVLAKKKTIKTV